MDWSQIATLVGSVVMGLGGGAWVTSWWSKFKSNAPQVTDLVEDVIKKMTPSTSSSPDRMEALTQAEALLRYFEAKGNTAGGEAILVVTKEILSTKA